MSKKVGHLRHWWPLWRESTIVTPYRTPIVKLRARSVVRTLRGGPADWSGAASAECGCRVVGRMAEAKRRTGARLYGSARSGAEPRPPPAKGGGGVNSLGAQRLPYGIPAFYSRPFEVWAERASSKQCRASRPLCLSPPVSGCRKNHTYSVTW